MGLGEVHYLQTSLFSLLKVIDNPSAYHMDVLFGEILGLTHPVCAFCGYRHISSKPSSILKYLWVLWVLLLIVVF